MSEMEGAFVRNTTMRRRDGRVQIDCRRGLWAVDCPDLSSALREARHYFAQYYADGEYDKPATPEVPT